MRAGQKTWSIDVAYYPPDDSILYLRLQDGQQLVPCTLVDRVNEQSWKAQDWYDVEDYFALKSIETLDAKYNAPHATIEFDVQEEAIVKMGQEELAREIMPQSKSSQLKGIANNYKQEQKQEHRTNPPVPKRVAPPSAPPAAIDEDFIPDDSPFDLLREAQEELRSQTASH